MENKIRYIIIPDVHGRKFWREAVEKYKDDDVIFIFLGDYIDPYTYEGINNTDAYKEFLDILKFKEDYSEKVVLLLGNHDVHYINMNCGGSRLDYLNFQRNHTIYMTHLSEFNMTYEVELNGKKFLFSHAGVNTQWLEYFNKRVLGIDTDFSSLHFEFNSLLSDAKEKLGEPKIQKFINTLGIVSWYRGGSHNYGSMVWADIDEYCSPDNRLPGYVQVVGHSQQRANPYNIEDEVICLDCRRYFLLTEDGIIREHDMSDIEYEFPK